MSSHHVVKEKQEPGLLILTLDRFETEHLGQLLEWSPTVLVSEIAAGMTNDSGIKVDGVMTTNPELPVQPHAKRIICRGDYLQTGMDYFLNEGFPAVNIIDDAFDPDRYNRYAEQTDLVIYVNNKKTYAVRSGFSKWKMEGELLEITEPEQIRSLNNLAPVSDHLFRVVNDGFCSLTISGPFIFVAEEF